MSQQLKEVKTKKAGRRGNNEGSIFQRKDGRWCGQVTIGYKTDGKPIRKTIYGTSRQEVAKAVAAKTDEVFANGYISVSAQNERNFQVLMQEWFNVFVAPGYESGTEANRRNMLKNHIFKEFGAFDIENVTLEKLQKFFNGKVKNGTAADSVNKMKNLLKNFFTYAVKKGFIRENPMLEVVIRKRTDSGEENEVKALRPEIRPKVFEWVMDNTILKPIIITFCLTGLRPQELIALEWKHVNLDTKTISIKQALKRVVEFDDEGNVSSHGAIIGKTKTPKSVRGFLLPDIVVDVLREWAGYCAEKNIVSNFVFPNTKTGGMRTYSGLRSLLNRFIKIHNLESEEITLYTFRHTFATVLLEQRENPKIVANLMGHKKASTTLNFYSHVINNDVYEKTAQTLDGTFANLLNPRNPAAVTNPSQG
jgi:integrase